MRQIVRAAVRDPRMVARNKAIEITRGVASKDFRGEIETVYDWVDRNIRFVKDINGIETLQTPTRTLQLEVGDCDDHSILLSALLESIGHPTRFVAVGFSPGNFSHVLTETRLGGRWIPLETTVPGAHIGWYPPGVRARMVQNIQSY
jgi:transglutaminase-like putative cysteine protease